jgi:alanine-glyoxylate transaminase/serine-glyoxylate transaminase/serine-pyruvate transaminase
MKNALGLMIPGPCPVESDILLEMASPMVAHYGPEWAGIFHETRELMKQVVGTQQDLFITVGSGHLAVETMISNALAPGETVLIVDNGHFARRAADIARLYGIEAIDLTLPWGSAASPETVAEAMCKHRSRGIKAVLLVQNESSTGVINPVESIARVVQSHGALMLVDGVSSIGCMDFQMDRWQVDLCVTASQKGLEAPPGLCMVAVSERAWEAIAGRRTPYAGWYMNLLLWRKFHQESYHFQPYGITMAVSNVLALRKSLQKIMQEGLQRRYLRHELVARFFRSGLRRLGLEPGSKEEACSSPTITAAFGGPDFCPRQAAQFLKERYGIMIAGGLSEWEGSVVRFGHMGPGATLAAVIPVLVGLAQLQAAGGAEFDTAISLADLEQTYGNGG